MAKRPMKKYQIARPYQSYEFMDLPDSFTVRCPDGTPIEMNIDPEFISRDGGTCSYIGENPFIWVSVDYGLSGARYFESEEPQSLMATMSVWCERRTTPDFYVYEKEGIRRAHLEGNPTLEEVISKTEELIAQIWDYALDYAKIEESAKKSKKAKMMAKRMNKKVRKEEYKDIDDDDVVEIEEEDGQKKVEIESKEEHEKEVEDGEESESDNLNAFIRNKRASAKKKVRKSAVRKYYDDRGLCDDIVTVYYDKMTDDERRAINSALDNYVTGWNFPGFIDDLFNDFADIMDNMGAEDDDYEASTKKSMNKSKYSDIHKRLAKLGGFTKEDDDIEIEVGDKEIEIEDKEKDEEFLEEDEQEIEESCKGCKGMKSKKMKKDGELPEDADDQQDINEKGEGSADEELPEDADENEEISEAGEGNAEDELPEDADEQEDIKQSARKKVRKFSVTNGGSPDQTSYNGRYSQNPMVRNAIDGHFGSKSEKSFDEVAMMQERIDELRKSRRNPSMDNGVPKRLR